MTTFSNIAYAEIDLKFDRNLFIEEYDREIYSRSSPFVPIYDQWGKMRELNSFWNVLESERFEKYDKLIQEGATELDGATHQWDMVNLMSTENKSTPTGAYWRNKNRYEKKFVKPEFENLEILKWINANIPAKQIIGIHCVSIEPGSWATIHRDSKWPEQGNNPAMHNGFYQDGFVVICLNISNGESPLLWSLDHEIQTPRSTDADCFMISDYFYHAVPVVKTRRRQIRVSIIPDDNLSALIKTGTEVIVPDDYQYTL